MNLQLFRVIIRDPSGKLHESLLSITGSVVDTHVVEWDSRVASQQDAELEAELAAHNQERADAKSAVENDYRVLRSARYRKEIDPWMNEALLENAGGRPEKLTALLALREQIRAEFPKPL